MSTITRSLSLVATIVASAVAMALPASASANTAGGGGGAPFTIYAQNFTAYGCTHYRTKQGIAYYSCSGGVRSGGYFYQGYKCARKNVTWGWYNQPCWQVL